MRVIVGITGGIAAYKAPLLARLLVKAGHEVQCVATSHALEFVTPLTLETVSGRRLYSDLFSPANDHSTEHISLKDWGDAMVVAPATANIIGKLASGIGDDALSTLLLSFSGKPLFVAPAMNTQMWEHPAVQRNVSYLRSTGVNIIEPASGQLACGATALFPSCNAAILSAAVADYRPDHAADHKLKKQGDEGMTLHLVQNPDILATLGTMKQEGQTLVGFALETDNELANAQRKLERKNLDFIVLNSLKDAGAGFGVDTNRVTIISRDGAEGEGDTYTTPLLSKREVAEVIVNRCIEGAKGLER